MKILLVGASGAVGQAVHETLVERDHEVIAAHRGSHEWPVDIADPDQIRALLEKTGELDAVACAAGSTPSGPWAEMDRDAWLAGLEGKLLGQVELVRQAAAKVRKGGSFTLITGIIGREPIRNGSVAAAINGALETWVRAVAADFAGEYRINAVSPTVLTESLPKYGKAFPGFPSVPAKEVAHAYVRSIEGIDTGRVYMP